MHDVWLLRNILAMKVIFPFPPTFRITDTWWDALMLINQPSSLFLLHPDKSSNSNLVIKVGGLQGILLRQGITVSLCWLWLPLIDALVESWSPGVKAQLQNVEEFLAQMRLGPKQQGFTGWEGLVGISLGLLRSMKTLYHTTMPYRTVQYHTVPYRPVLYYCKKTCWNRTTWPVINASGNLELNMCGNSGSGGAFESVEGHLLVGANPR